MTNDIQISDMRAKTLVSTLQDVNARVQKAAEGRKVRLVAVSKLKPPSDILALYRDGGQKHFGENYAQELMEKAKMLPDDIQWHFIGGLQTGKCKPLASTLPNLHTVSSVDKPPKATELNKGRSKWRKLDPKHDPLNVHIQVNTSGEDSKSGVSPGQEASDLAKHILTACEDLKLTGLMTIGAIARSKATGEGEENEDFKTLKIERDRLEKEFEAELKGSRLELSMGMSEDFEGAIKMGSDEVRVGSTIFGTRPPKNEFSVKGEVKAEQS